MAVQTCGDVIKVKAPITRSWDLFFGSWRGRTLCHGYRMSVEHPVTQGQLRLTIWSSVLLVEKARGPRE